MRRAFEPGFISSLVVLCGLSAGAALLPGSSAADGFRPDARWNASDTPRRAGAFRPVGRPDRLPGAPDASPFAGQLPPSPHPAIGTYGGWEQPGFVRRSHGQFRPAGVAEEYAVAGAYRGRYGRKEDQFRPVRQREADGLRDNSAVLLGYEPRVQSFRDESDPLGGYRFTGGPNW